MKKQILTENYYGHQLEVELHLGEFQYEVEFIPDSVKKHIFSAMADSATDGEFDCEGIGYAGKWRFLELNYDLMRRIAMWQGNFNTEENLTKELFIEYFGESYGNHFYGKWNGEVKRDLMLMMAYFRSNRKHGQLFCNMLMRQVDRYNKRDV